MEILKPKALGVGVTHISRLQENCASCKFWQLAWTTDEVDQPLDPELHCGNCRRYPPTLEVEPPQCYPITRSSMWCGEYQRKVTHVSNTQA